MLRLGCFEYRRHEARKPAFHFSASKCVDHFYAAAFGTDKPGLPQDLEVVRLGGLGHRLRRRRLAIQTTPAASPKLADDFQPDWVSQGIEHAFQRDGFDRRVDKRALHSANMHTKT
jgi:hypothetical protein